ncbi:hypothetical protein [Sphingorhabdus sp. Alg239-R122]|uniref:hypothetical protein n=1 Tax=Sphingorhabdus sp. Alg239-R122 TaxID=2305989 RepID=UPI0013D8E5B9|nr:hypothetical protein [Sphingorhabdus sp. Alg239-R122]
MKFLASIPAIMVFSAFAVTPAQAQEQLPPADAENYRVNTLMIFEGEECPPSTDEEIVICGVVDRYRIPKVLREDPNDPVNQSWSQKVKSFQYVGATGTESCSPVGAGGFTGCTTQLINRAYKEREQAPEKRYGQLIEEARGERLSRIDEEAAEVQARREAIEAELEARERAAAEAAENAAAEEAVEAEGELPNPE